MDGILDNSVVKASLIYCLYWEAKEGLGRLKSLKYFKAGPLAHAILFILFQLQCVDEGAAITLPIS